MITLKEWMELVDYRVTEGSDYGWQCFGPNAYTLTSWSGTHDGWSLNITFDTETQVVYMVEVCDYLNERAYRMVNQDFADEHREESNQHPPANQAWDDVDYIDLEVDDDFIQKCLAIIAGEQYDTRVEVPLTLPDDAIFELMKLAHEQDVTLNTLVENMLRDYIKQHGDNAVLEKKKKKRKN